VDRDKLINRRIQSIAKDQGCSVAEVYAVLDTHPIEIDRDKFLRRTLALELSKLDQLEEAFVGKAMAGDVAAGTLLIKIYERRATLLGLNPPLGHAVHIVQHPPEHRETNMDKIERVLRELTGPPKSGDGSDDPDRLN
jgi:hypothetical protein